MSILENLEWNLICGALNGAVNHQIGPQGRVVRTGGGMNRTSPLLQHPHPGCDLARPGGHGADRNLNFRMSVQAGCCVGTSAGDYPINPVEWSPVTSPGCPGKWGLKHSNQDENNYKLVNHQYSSVQSTFLFVCWVCSNIFKIQFHQHTARCTAVDNLWWRFQWHWHEGSNAIKHRGQLGTWLTLLACRPRHNTTYKPPSNDSCPLNCPSRVSRQRVWRNIPRHQYQSIINLHCGCLYGVIYQVMRLNIFTVILLDKCCKYFLKKGPWQEKLGSILSGEREVQI